MRASPPEATEATLCFPADRILPQGSMNTVLIGGKPLNSTEA